MVYNNLGSWLVRGTPSTSPPTANHGNVSSPQLVLLVLDDGICNVETASGCWKHGNIVDLDPHNGHELNSAVVCGGNVAVE